MSSESSLKLTPSQTVGPFFTIGLSAVEDHNPLGSPIGNTITGAGQEITLCGRILDGNGEPVVDALVEIWQADSNGTYAAEGFIGFARSDTSNNVDSSYSFTTIKPGAVNASDAPYISMIISMRGLLTHTYTRLYFSDEAQTNSNDPVLSQIPEGRRATLLAQRHGDDPIPSYQFDVRMQGDNETVFFAV